MTSFSRRGALKLIGASATAASVARGQDTATESTFESQWHRTNERVFLGGDYWANPMENWSIVDGSAECQSRSGDRNIHLITHQLTENGSDFDMSVKITQVEDGKDGGAGFRIGTRSELDEHRSNCFAKNGIDAGVTGNTLTLGNGSIRIPDNLPRTYRLTLSGAPSGARYQLRLTVFDAENDKKIAQIDNTVDFAKVLGNVSLVNNYFRGGRRNQEAKGKVGARHQFRNWQVSGDAFTVDRNRRFGPILWSMYSLSDSRSDEGFVMKMTALTGPLGPADNQDVELQVKTDADWKTLGKAKLDTDAWTATFRIPKWNEKVATKYRLVYREKRSDQSEAEHEWTGVVRANPTGRPLRLGALTCQNDYGFPYEPVANNVVKLDPDMLYFSGDQIYESHGGYGLIRRPADRAILNYLRKFYQFGWSFREALRNAPAICLPDDHDVFQGNIWGEGGAPETKETGGGYTEPARMVNAVHRTCCSHHPDFYDPAVVEQDISVYFGDMVYGNVSFAILGDRQWKSGPARVATWGGRPDHLRDKNIDPKELDKPGLQLLGERQEKFLKAWSEDWRGHEMKVLLSQTVFAGVATHHGGYDGYLLADLDSGGWPQTPRNNAIKIIRPAKPLHINGDQHLTSLCQYGVDKQRDGFWSFCTPAIAAGYPRWWRPDELKVPHENRPKHGLANTGEFIDSFGNNVYVYAIGNPVVGKSKNRYEKAHEKGSGFGLVTIDTAAKTYHLDCFKFMVDPTDGKADNQFPGWPVTIHQKENGGDNLLG